MERLLQELRNEILLLFQLILESQYGINQKTGTNTLADSELLSTARVDGGDWIFTLWYNDYMQYIESGRRAGARKVPVDALRKWAVKKGIPTDNRVIYAIRESIYRNGIPARPITPHFEGELDESWNEWADRIFDEITNRLDKYFNE